MRKRQPLIAITARLPRRVVKDLERVLRIPKYQQLSRSEFISFAVERAVSNAIAEFKTELEERA